jgi:hypothetical protein
MGDIYVVIHLQFVVVIACLNKGLYNLQFNYNPLPEREEAEEFSFGCFSAYLFYTLKPETNVLLSLTSMLMVIGCAYSWCLSGLRSSLSYQDYCVPLFTSSSLGLCNF